MDALQVRLADIATEQRDHPATRHGRWLIGEPLTHRLIAGWTVAYALGSWLLEYGYSRFGIARPPPGPLAVKCVIYAIVWAPLLLGAVYLSDR